MEDILNGKNIVLGVCGGIAAYKAAELCSALVKGGADVNVIMTQNATRFVGPVTFRALTGRQVITSMWDEPREYEIAHVSLPDKADLLIVAPATANMIAKVANGVADDMLSTTILATKSPVVFAPAMNWKMWANPVTKQNVAKLTALGYSFIEPECGRLACGEEGRGRLASLGAILRTIEEILSRKHDLEGVTVLVTAGPTQEPIDPVRVIANRSSGKMGYAIAQDAAERGARVILVSGPTDIPIPAGVELVGVQTAAEMYDAVMRYLPEAQVIIGAAAPADYTPKSPKDQKIKKSDRALTIELEPTRDIIAEVGKVKDGCIVVAFAAETQDLIENARKKIEAKNADFIVANDVSRTDIGFGTDENQVTIIGRDGSIHELPRISKREVGNKILDLVKEALGKNG